MIKIVLSILQAGMDSMVNQGATKEHSHGYVTEFIFGDHPSGLKHALKSNKSCPGRRPGYYVIQFYHLLI